MQKTLAKSIKFTGVGVHSGEMATISILPASAEYGIWFRRTDVIGKDNLIPARFDQVTDTQLCTKISNGDGVSVSTIEHLMAALAGTGIQNALIEVNGPEVPIMDGSSQEFVSAILSAGLRELDAPIYAIKIVKPIEVTYDDVEVSLSPADVLEIDYQIEYQAPAIGTQHKEMALANGGFVRELSDCRTFCLRKDVEMMQAHGLAQGGSLENAVVVDDETVMNPEGFRHVDECVRHKMLDALGDLALAGAPILGRYRGLRAGHKATNLLLRALFSQRDAYEIVTCDEKMLANLPGAHIRAEDLRQSA